MLQLSRDETGAATAATTAAGVYFWPNVLLVRSVFCVGRREVIISQRLFALQTKGFPGCGTCRLDSILAALEHHHNTSDAVPYTFPREHPPEVLLRSGMERDKRWGFPSKWDAEIDQEGVGAIGAGCRSSV